MYAISFHTCPHDFFLTFIRLMYSSLSLVAHRSPSRGPAFVRRRGMEASVRFVASSTMLLQYYFWIRKFRYLKLVKRTMGKIYFRLASFYLFSSDKCYAKSPTTQHTFCPMPGLIRCTGVTVWQPEPELLSHAQNEVLNEERNANQREVLEEGCVGEDKLCLI